MIVSQRSNNERLVQGYGRVAWRAESAEGHARNRWVNDAA